MPSQISHPPKCKSIQLVFPSGMPGSKLTSSSDNMRGWHEHFERKYIVCGELVETITPS